MMKTVFELTRIDTNSKARYPIRKTKPYDLGLFSTLANAEKRMLRDVKECQEYEKEWQKDVAEDEEFRMDEKKLGHDIVLAYKIGELELDSEIGYETQSVRTYTADGQPNDECLLDSGCKRHFKGRTPDQIRFQPGDIVEVITEGMRSYVLCGTLNPPQRTTQTSGQNGWKIIKKDVKDGALNTTRKKHSIGIILTIVIRCSH